MIVFLGFLSLTGAKLLKFINGHYVQLKMEDFLYESGAQRGGIFDISRQRYLCLNQNRPLYAN